MYAPQSLKFHHGQWFANTGIYSKVSVKLLYKVDKILH